MNTTRIARIDRAGAITACAALAVVAGWWAAEAGSGRQAAAPPGLRGGRYVPAEWSEAARVPVPLPPGEESSEEDAGAGSEPPGPVVPPAEPPATPGQPRLEAVVGSATAPVAAFRMPGRPQPVLVRPGEGIPGTGLSLREIVRRRVAVRHRDGWPVDEVQTRARVVGPEGESELTLGRESARRAQEVER